MKFHPILLLGLAVLLYSGLAAFHNARAHAEEDEVPVPFDVILSTFAGLAISVVGALSGIPEFKVTKGLVSLNSVQRDDYLDRITMRKYYHRARDFKQRLASAAS